MILVPLSQVPNQSFSLNIDNNNWDIRLRSANNITAVDITLNNNLIISGVRANPNFLLIPYEYLFNNNGNFIIYCPDDSYPDYTQFGVTQNMYYLSPDDLGEIGAGT